MLQAELKTQFAGMFVPQSLNDRLEALARAEDRNKSQIIRRLLETALQARARKT